MGGHTGAADKRIVASSGGEEDLLNFYVTTTRSAYRGVKGIGDGIGAAAAAGAAPAAPAVTAVPKKIGSGFSRNVPAFVPPVEPDADEPDETPVRNLPGQKPHRVDREKKVKGSMAKTSFLPSVVLDGREPAPARVNLEHSGFSSNIRNTLLKKASFQTEPPPPKVLETLKVKNTVEAENGGRGPEPWSTTYRATVSSKPGDAEPSLADVPPRLEETGYTKNSLPFVERPLMSDDVRTPGYHEVFRVPPTAMERLESAMAAPGVYMEQSSYSLNNSRGGKVGSKKLARNMQLDPPALHPSIVSKMKVQDPVEYKNLQQPNLMVSTYGCTFEGPADDAPLPRKDYFGPGRSGGSGFASNNPPAAVVAEPLDDTREEPDPKVQRRKEAAATAALADRYALKQVVMEHSGFTHGESRILKEPAQAPAAVYASPMAQKLATMRQDDGPATRIV